MKKKIFQILFLLIANLSYSQVTDLSNNYFKCNFDGYKTAYKTTLKKSPLNTSSNSIYKYYTSRIKEGYKLGKPDFAGYYIVITWGCGTGCILGAMVDVRDGRIYTLPLDEELSYGLGDDCEFCKLSSEDERYSYRLNSSLFVTSTCTLEDIPNSRNSRHVRFFYVNVWNEKLKKFELIDKVTKYNENDFIKRN
jgi:hypothetical protein